MAVTLIENDLLAIISRDELDGIARELIETGQPDPITVGIAEGLGTIKLYCDPFLIADDALRKIWRITTVAALYNRLARLPAKRKEEWEWVIKVLEGIRDGKFKNLGVDPTLPASSASKGQWGSGTKF